MSPNSEQVEYREKKNLKTALLTSSSLKNLSKILSHISPYFFLPGRAAAQSV